MHNTPNTPCNAHVWVHSQADPGCSKLAYSAVRRHACLPACCYLSGLLPCLQLAQPTQLEHSLLLDTMPSSTSCVVTRCAPLPPYWPSSLQLAQPSLERSKVVSDDGSGKLDSVRTSSGTFLPKAADAVVAGVEARVAAATHLPDSHAENLQILK